MKMTQKILSHHLRQHWFFLVAAVMISGDWIAVRSDSWTYPRVLEAAVLGDLVLIMPMLYLFCYRAQGKAVVFRTLALSCSAIWLCSYIIPQIHHHLLATFGWLRYAGIAVLTVVEFKVTLAMLRVLFNTKLSKDETIKTIASQSDMPMWMANWMAIEAKFWIGLGNFLKRIMPRKDR
jgi:hypothetical protein